MAEVTRFPTHNGFIQAKISDEIYDILLSASEQSKSEKLDITDRLIGNLEETYDLTQMPFYQFNKVETYLRDLCGEFEQNFELMKSYKIFSAPNGSIDLNLKMLWVNYQKKYEFNPVHHHSGLYSFVIWMKIPYSCEEDEFKEKRGNPTQKYAGTFCFLDTDPVSGIEDFKIKLDSSYEKTILIFPSKLRHIVYPFYTSDDYRISISGNFYLEPVTRF